MRLISNLLGMLAGLICFVSAGAAQAGDAWKLSDVLRIDDVIEVLRDEGLKFGADLDNDMLAGRGGAFWATQVGRVYDLAWMKDTVRIALSQGLSDTEIAQALDFFDTELGQKILSLETSARRAMTNPEVEEIAHDAYLSLKGSDDARLATITRFIEVNDLLERNVAGSLNASYAFMRGLVQGGGSEMSDEEITADIWAQEEETRVDTQEWLYGFMLLAYRPLSDAQLEAYIAFSETTAGQALNGALFDGFDNMYRGISHALGVQVAEAASYKEL